MKENMRQVQVSLSVQKAWEAQKIQYYDDNNNNNDIYVHKNKSCIKEFTVLGVFPTEIR